MGDRTEYMADYYQKNKEKKQAYSKDYYQEKKAEINERNRQWYWKHKNAPSKRIYYRQKDVLKVLSSQRKNIGDVAYHLLIEEMKKLNKEEFRT